MKMIDIRSVADQTAVGRYRWTICALIFFATTINYMDRQMLGLLAPLLQKDIGWNQVQYAQTVMVFTVAYAVGLAIFGRIADRISTKVVYGSAMAMWSLAAMLHALAATVPGFAAVRGLLGFGEAANFPVAIRTTATWFPKKERALATGLWNMGATFGGIVAPAFVPIAAVMWGLACDVRCGRGGRFRVAGGVAAGVPPSRGACVGIEARTGLHQFGPGRKRRAIRQVAFGAEVPRNVGVHFWQTADRSGVVVLSVLAAQMAQ
jgi:ACS family hexuronate transporter-like MFS transporter